MRLGGTALQMTCSQDHEYTAEQKAFHGGAMDQFIENTEVSDCKPPVFKVPGMVMAYYDGNSVTALWNFAQHYAMSDNPYDTTLGPSVLDPLSAEDRQRFLVNVPPPQRIAFQLFGMRVYAAYRAELYGSPVST